MEVLGQDVEEEDDDEKVEGIERPAEKASRNGVPAVKGFGDTRCREVSHWLEPNAQSAAERRYQKQARSE